MRFIKAGHDHWFFGKRRSKVCQVFSGRLHVSIVEVLSVCLYAIFGNVWFPFLVPLGAQVSLYIHSRLLRSIASEF